VWNDTLQLPFKLPNQTEFSPTAMLECRDQIVVSLYDQVGPSCT
jgi:hypothetical protein